MKNYKNPKYVPFGGMLQKQENDSQGRASYWIKIDKNVVVTVDGKKVSAINISRPVDKYERMLASGAITEAEFEDKAAAHEEGGSLSFVKFELTVNLDEKK